MVIPFQLHRVISGIVSLAVDDNIHLSLSTRCTLFNDTLCNRHLSLLPLPLSLFLLTSAFARTKNACLAFVVVTKHIDSCF